MLDVDGDDSAEPLTDGLLILRRRFGFAGTALIEGAIGQDCTRCSAATVEPYLDSFLPGSLDRRHRAPRQAAGYACRRCLLSSSSTTVRAPGPTSRSIASKKWRRAAGPI